MVALEVEDEQIRLHDPYGYPYAVVAPSDLLAAWRADRITYKRGPFTLRSRFRQVEHVSREESIARTLPLARSNLIADPGGPVVFGGLRALAMVAEDLRGEVPEALAGHLVYFAMPLAARRCLDASAFVHEAGNDVAAWHLERKARRFGEAQSFAVRHQWASVVAIVEQLADIERELIQAMA